MAFIGVNIAIVHQGSVLLTQREDFEVWCLPGGHVDPGESVAQGALREAKEETGLDVALDQLVGVYSTPHWAEGGAHIVVFAAHPVGGDLQRQEDEVLAMDWFPLDEPPEPLMWQHRQRIADAAAFVSGQRAAMAWNQDLVWPGGDVDSLQSLYPLRDASGLSRLAFYEQHIGAPGEFGEVCEVGAPPEGDTAPGSGPLEIVTPRLRLREYRADDWRAVMAYQSEPRFLTWYPVASYTEENARSFVGMFLGWQREAPRYRWQLAITERETGVLIGSCGIRRDAPDAQVASLGYELMPNLWGRGYATEAAGAILAWGFRELGLYRVWARVLAHNDASANVLHKLGFRQEGRLREHADMGDTWCDELLFGILAGEWREQQSEEQTT